MTYSQLLSAKLRKYRDIKQITMEEMADIIGISMRQLSAIENMECEIMTDTIDAIAAATGIMFITCTTDRDSGDRYSQFSPKVGIYGEEEFILM